MENSYISNGQTVYLIRYHFVFCTRYRRKVLEKEVSLRFHELILDVSQEHQWEIIQATLNPDHSYLYLGATPSVSPAEVMVKIKGWTSRKLREEFQHLSHLPCLWTRSFFVSTEEAVPNRLIQDYISQQKKRG